MTDNRATPRLADPAASSGGRGMSATEIVDIERISGTDFRSVHNFSNMAGSIFGGQLLALGLRAAQQTSHGWPAHNCTGYFLSGASAAIPLEFEVAITRDGKRFAGRHVTCRQNGMAVFDMFCSFNAEIEGIAHQSAIMGDQPDPEQLPTLVDHLRSNPGRLGNNSILGLIAQHPIETRPVHPQAHFLGEGGNPELNYWIRIPSAADITDPQAHACLTAFLSDWWVGSTPMLRHRTPSEAGAQFRIVTINHSMWFHGPARADQWLLYRTTSPWAQAGRATVSGTIFDRSGTVIATVMQEVAITPKRQEA